MRRIPCQKKAFPFPALAFLHSIMFRFAVLLFLSLLAAPLPAQAQASLVAQVGLLPPAPGPHPDLVDVLRRFWPEYYDTDGALSFTLDNIRVGRIDLNDDDRAELILMIDKPGWEIAIGKPFVICTWRKTNWVAIGWGWGDEDTLFVQSDTYRGWHSLDTGTTIMRWTGKEYERQPKN